jgi:signal recognition particle GTPase
MFENLSDKLDRAFKVLKGQGTITEINVAESARPFWTLTLTIKPPKALLTK